ncbi:hypothetical protein FB45DRAFT_1029271 [Roridomyces roridus]|uniref:Uncharacterized protein n=1 Tax=Roridomyces roridus TaxID=1738132 RepID=A0AAD7BPA9_9AGAR|nr:hypothetical protein FB45DRAFT_1029271 [Roridomyces roridus]
MSDTYDSNVRRPSPCDVGRFSAQLPTPPATPPTFRLCTPPPVCPPTPESLPDTTRRSKSPVPPIPACSMDYEQYATAITNELRDWAHAWLAGVGSNWLRHVELGLPLPRPNYPLPSSFPFGTSEIQQTFQWVHEYGGTNQIRHSYAVCLAFHGRTRGPGSSVAWKIVSGSFRFHLFPAKPRRGTDPMPYLSAGNIELGVFEIAGPIYDDDRRTLPFVLGAELVLDALLLSLALRQPVRLASYRFSLPPGTPRSRGSSSTMSGIQFFELRTPEEEVVKHLGARPL